MGLEAGGRGGAEEEEEEEEEKEKIPHMCGSIGHRPLWGRCPKSLKLPKVKRGPTDQPTDRRADKPT